LADGGGSGGAALEPDAVDARRGFDRAANLLGALALVVADRASDATAAAAGRSESAAAALSALLHFLDRPSVDLLRQVLGLTSSGTVRLLDRLADSGYIRREPGADGRSTSVTLTKAGQRAAREVTQARARVLMAALATLAPDERATFERLAGKMLGGMRRGPGATRWICRLCDIGVCRGAASGCPFRSAAADRDHG
jgi:DNA-binding MarR family transcriptional regulator